MVWETHRICEEGGHNQLTYLENFHSVYILTLKICLDMCHPTSLACKSIHFTTTSLACKTKLEMAF